jgi:hypothetical protein
MNKNPLSLSRKIQKTLEICGKINRKGDHAEIIKYIKNKKLESSEIEEFVYFSKKGKKSLISDRAIKRIINYCVSFNLIEEKFCILTSDGALASQNDDNFEQVLKESIKKYLKRAHNYELKDVRTQIEKVFDSDGSCRIPIPEQIWSLVTSDIKKKNDSLKDDEKIKKIPLRTFKTILGLLGDCDYLTIHRKKMYTIPRSLQEKMISEVLELV